MGMMMEQIMPAGQALGVPAAFLIFLNNLIKAPLFKGEVFL